MPKKIKIDDVTSWWDDLLRGSGGGLLAESLRGAARLGSWGYGMGVRSREAAYQTGLLQIKRLPRPTVCVGNITVGGTGKTPLVMRLVSDLLAKGCKPAVLLRGYKREIKTSRSLLVRGPEKIETTVRESGDEAMELARRLPGACVGVGADRYASGSMILKRFPVDCFVMDDGFQHYQLHRDVNIVTVDVIDPWGGGKLLPAGLLRESPEALRRADLVILTRTGSIGPDRLAVLRAEVSTFMRSNAFVLESRHEPRCLISLADSREYPLSKLKGKKVLAVSGIANPQSFENSLSAYGSEIVARHRLGDHQGRPRDVWKWIATHRKDGAWPVMTEKDAVRWTSEEVPQELLSHAYALRMELVLSSGREIWQKMIKRLAAPLNTPLILLDRDGTLITEQDYLKDPRKVKLLPGAVAGLRLLARAGLPMVVVSNQSGVGRGLMTRQDVGRVHKRFESLLRAQGVRLAGIYWCPHRPNVRCACRKPGLKLVRQAARDLKMSWKGSISVGDKWSDVQLGQRTGGQGVLVLTGYGRESRKHQGRQKKADFVARNFQAAARWIVKAAQKES